MEEVQVEYVPEKAELDDGIDEEFRKVFEKFSFWEAAGSEVKSNSVLYDQLIFEFSC